MELIQNSSLGSYIGSVAQRYGQRPAIRYREQTLTYAEVWAQSSLIAKGMLALGIGRGIHVGLWANDRPNTLLCLLALFRIGAVGVMLSTSLPKIDLEKRILDTDIAYILFDEGYRSTDFAAICAEIAAPVQSHRIYIGLSRRTGFMTLADLIAQGSRISEEELAATEAGVSPEDVDLLLFTSGSTTAPRAVQTTHYSRLNTARMQAECLCGTEADRYCVSMPMFHCFSLTGVVLAALCTGACVCFPEDRHTSTLLRLIAEERCTIFSGVPALFSAILARNDFDTWDLTSLRTGMIGGASYPPKLFREICRRFGYTLLSSLGQTEATAGITSASLCDTLEVRSETVGRIWDKTEGRIIDPLTGEDVRPGCVGEICIRGFNVMQGYYRDPELTSRVFSPDGWLRTGDLAWQDACGNLHLSGRLKEVIIRGGENIAPGEIEVILSEHPSVAQSKVVGVPDPHYGEEICALIVPDRPDLEADLRRMIPHRLEPFKVPRYFVFLNQLPMTTTGKIDTTACKQLAKSEIVNRSKQQQFGENAYESKTTC